MALVFKPKQETAELPFLDGSTILLKRPSREMKRRLYREIDAQAIAGTLEGITTYKEGWDEKLVEDAKTDAFFAAHIIGWRDIVDEHKKPLAFNKTTHRWIFEEIERNKDAAEKFYAFIGGVLGNLPAGSTVSTPGAGNQAGPANDASAKQQTL